MKRIAVISIIMGIIPIYAQAAVSLAVGGNPAPSELTLTVSSILTIGGLSDDDSPYVVYFGLEDPGNTGEWVSDIITAPGVDATPAYHGSWQISAFMSPPPPVPIPGLHWEIDFHCKGLGDAFIFIYADDYYTLLDSITIHQVPEPMSVLLLGAGGLLLRKRK